MGILFSYYTVVNTCTLFNTLPLDIVLVIANNLTSFGVENLCVNKYLKKNLSCLIKKKTIEELQKVEFAKPWYPMDAKQNIYDDEVALYKDLQIVPVYFDGKEIGRAKRRAILEGFWCGYYNLPINIIENIDMRKYEPYELFEFIDFNEEITFCREIKETKDFIIGWDYAHADNEGIKGYQTLEATIDQIINCHKKCLANTQNIITKFS